MKEITSPHIEKLHTNYLVWSWNWFLLWLFILNSNPCCLEPKVRVLVVNMAQESSLDANQIVRVMFKVVCLVVNMICWKLSLVTFERFQDSKSWRKCLFVCMALLKTKILHCWQLLAVAFIDSRWQLLAVASQLGSPPELFYSTPRVLWVFSNYGTTSYGLIMEFLQPK